MNKNLPYKTKLKTGLTIGGVFLLLLLSSSCFQEVELNHPDDPLSEFYINGQGDPCSAIDSARINIHSAKIYWNWTKIYENNSLVNIKTVMIQRTSLSDPREMVEFAIPIDSVKIDTTLPCGTEYDSSFYWIDTTLTMEQQYQYVIRVSNNFGIAKDSIVVNYYHGFYPLDSLQLSQEKSDTSITCRWTNNDWLQDSVKLVWKYSDNDSILGKQILRGDVTTAELINPSVDLYRLTKMEFFYGLVDEGITIWQREPITDTLTLEFEPVNALQAVPFQKGINRVTWRYDSKKVQPSYFILNQTITIPNAPSLMQNIGNTKYFSYYDSYITDTLQQKEYTILPVTARNTGGMASVTCEANRDYSGFCYIDSSFDDNFYLSGFYISLYEMTIGDFIDYYNELEWDPSFFINNSKREANMITIINGRLTVTDPSLLNLPIDNLTWTIADSLARAIPGHRLPTHKEWKLAARAYSDDRTYPWGWDDPGPPLTYCNYDNPNGPIRVDTLEIGRVTIHWPQQIQGPYQMSGNVREWVSDNFTLRGLPAHLAKGGSWKDAEEFYLEIDDESRIYTEVDPEAGLRLIKE